MAFILIYKNKIFTTKIRNRNELAILWIGIGTPFVDWAVYRNKGRGHDHRALSVFNGVLYAKQYLIYLRRSEKYLKIMIGFEGISMMRIVIACCNCK